MKTRRAGIARIFIAVFVIIFTGFSSTGSFAQDSISIARNYYRNNLNRIIKNVALYRDSLRCRLFMDMDTLPLLLRERVPIKEIKEEIFSYEGINYRLRFYDLDGDNKPEAWAFFSPGKETTQEFGNMYDLNRDGKVDYILYHGGLMISHDKQFYYYFYHLIDEDYDGKIDTWTNSVAIQPGDKDPDPHWVLWVKCTNQDGKPEAVNYLNIPGCMFRPVDKSADKWMYKTFFGNKELDASNPDFFSFHNLLLDKLRNFNP